MSRTIPSAILTALAQPEVQPFYAVEFLFDTEPVRLWTGYGDRTIDGETYLGAGSLLNISGLEEAGDMSAKGVSVTHDEFVTCIADFAGMARAVYAAQGAHFVWRAKRR